MLVHRILLGIAAAAVASLIFVSIASAHSGTVTITCTSVTYQNYANFGSGPQQVLETVFIDNIQVAQTTFSFTGPSGGPSTLIVSVPTDGQPHDVEADAYSITEGAPVVGFPIDQILSCSPPPKCSPPPGQNLNFRWHYSANGSSGSWSGTQSTACPGSISEGPQAMEGDLKVAPGTMLMAGYDFTAPGNNRTFSVTVNSPQVVFTVRCVSGATPSATSLTVPMPTQTYSVTNSQWYPSGNQQSPLVYQGSISIPDLCAGGQLRLDKGGTFSATLS